MLCYFLVFGLSMPVAYHWCVREFLQKDDTQETVLFLLVFFLILLFLMWSSICCGNIKFHFIFRFLPITWRRTRNNVKYSFPACTITNLQSWRDFICWGEEGQIILTGIFMSGGRCYCLCPAGHASQVRVPFTQRVCFTVNGSCCSSVLDSGQHEAAHFVKLVSSCGNVDSQQQQLRATCLCY